VVRRSKAAAALASLERIGRHYGSDVAARKLALLDRLRRARLVRAAEVIRLHELLCFLDAYPDDRRIRALVRRMLRAFHRRPDLRRCRAALAGSGIAGTDIPFRFFWPSARWISRRWPGALRLDRDDTDGIQAMLDALPPLLPPVDAEVLRRAGNLTAFDRLRPRHLSDADYLVSAVEAMPGDEAARESLFDRIDASFVLRSGRTTPERTTARLDWIPLRFQREPLRGPKPDLREEAARAPKRVVGLGRARARRLVQIARISMATRERDLAVFQYPDARDAWVVDDGDGLAFAMLGTIPERRLLLPAVFAGLTLQNGVPIGYVQLDVVGRHAEISFNQFATFRGGGAARVFARLLAAAFHVFGCDRFSVEPYQLGDGNEEGIASGAWWFYHRLGFRPRSPGVRRIAAREVARIARDPRYRSSRRVLESLARGHLFFSLSPKGRAALPRTKALIEAAARELRRFGQAEASARESAAVMAARRWLGASAADASVERGLSRWAGIVLALAREGGWSRRERRELARLAAAKYGRDERDFLRRFAGLERLRRRLRC
jgi:hypothetical protein